MSSEESDKSSTVKSEVKEEVKQDENQKDSKPADDDNKVRLTYEKLLDKVTDHIKNQIDERKGLQRKVMDVMLAAINREVMSDPMAIKELIVKKMLVLPNSISHPPSQVLQLLMEHDADEHLGRLINKLFGDQKFKETDQEKNDKLRFKREFPAPIMTRTVAQIGQDLVQEHTYGDIVHARNLPEIPRDIEGYKRVADQLKPVWQNLRTKNAVYKTKYHICRVCRYKTDSLVAYSQHTWILHHDGKRYNCTMCPEFDNSEYRMRRHYLESHAVVPIPKEEIQTRFDCPICDLDFKYKGELHQHMKECKRTFSMNCKHMLKPKPEDHLFINQWLWPQPAQEPSVVNKRPAPPKPAPKPIRNVIPPMTNRNQPAVSRPGAASVRPNTSALPSNRPMAVIPTLEKLLPVLATLSNNPNALEKLKTEQPEVFKQLQGHFNTIRNNPQAMAQIKNLNLANLMKQGSRPSPSNSAAAAKKPTAGVRPPTTQTPVASSLQAKAPPTTCEICDVVIEGKAKYLEHMQSTHKKLQNKTITDMMTGAPLACSRCQQRFWCYDGLERHLVMSHGLVTQEYLRKAQVKEDGGRCQICKKQFAFNMLQHLVQEHKKNLCSAEIRYSCDLCQYSCTSYQDLEKHLSDQHPKMNASKH